MRSLLIHLDTLFPICPPTTGTTRGHQSVPFCHWLLHPGRADWDSSQIKHFVCGLSLICWQVLLPNPNAYFFSLQSRHNVNRAGLHRRMVWIYSHMRWLTSDLVIHNTHGVKINKSKQQLGNHHASYQWSDLHYNVNINAKEFPKEQDWTWL